MTLLDSNRQKVSGNFFQSLIPFVIKLFLSLKLLIAGEGMVMEPLPGRYKHFPLLTMHCRNSH